LPEIVHEGSPANGIIPRQAVPKKSLNPMKDKQLSPNSLLRAN
jgi:hypothetical protein